MTAPTSSSPTPRKRVYNTGVTRENAVRAADKLSALHGLDEWSMRQLLAELETSFSVVYRLVGDRDALSAAVIDSIAEQIETPGPDAPWDQWCRTVLGDLCTRIEAYPGAAQWLLTNGAATPHIVPIVLEALAVFRRAGFGDEAAAAYSVAFTSTVGLVAMNDNRRRPAVRAVDRNRALNDHVGLDGSEAEAALLQRFASGFADSQSATRTEHLEYTLDRVLEGLAVRLGELRDRTSRTDRED